ncbi:MAG: pitrilysin family protein [Planctomycetota bacterium]
MYKVFNKHLNEKYYFTRIGALPVFIIPKKSINEKVALLAVNYGSIDNSWQDNGNPLTVPEGIAHFLEHQQFKKADGDTSIEFARFGASYNASTGNRSTTYYFQSSENFLENLDVLFKVVFTSYFDGPNVAKEKSIIEQELRMYNDMPGFKVYDNLMSNLYKYHPVRISIGGTVESVRTITPELLAQCYRTFYQPSNMVLVICGDLEKDVERIIAHIRESQYLHHHPTGMEVTRNMPVEPPEINKPSSEENMSASTSSLLIGYKETRTGLEGISLLRQNIISDMLLDLLFGKSSKLYTKLYEEKLIDDRFGCGYSSHKTFGFTIISAETEQPEKLYQRIMDELRRPAVGKLCGNRELRQEQSKLMGKFIWAFNSPMAIASLFAGYYFNKVLSQNPGEEVYEMSGLIKKITLADIQNRLKEHLNPKYHAISLVRPLGNTI